MVVFVRKVRTASGATAVQIAERQDGRDKVLEHLGSAHTEAELASLVAVARRRMHPGQGELDLSAGAVPAGHAVITAKSSARVVAGPVERVHAVGVRRGR